ncbi:MAG: hypothetical protein WED00_17570 [Aquisalimonadaceae bacterium]
MNSELRMQFDDADQAKNLANQINSYADMDSLKARVEGTELVLTPPNPLVMDLINGLVSAVQWVRTLLQRDDNGSDVTEARA